MQKKGFLKRLCAIILAVSMVIPSAAVTSMLVPQNVEAANLFVLNVVDRLCTDVFNMCSRVVYAGVDKATMGMDPDSPFSKVKNIIFGDTTDHAAELCEEILQEIEDLDENLNDTRDYLANLITEFAHREDMKNLSNLSGQMNLVTADVETAWSVYKDYLDAVNDYAAYPTQTNLANAETEEALLYSYLEKMDFAGQMTKYIGYVSTVLVTEENNQAKTYLYWLYNFCQDEYAFDHQKYDTLSSAIDNQVGTIQRMMELHAVYISKLQSDYQKGTTELTEDELKLKVAEYNNCMNYGINACNNIAEQYASEMQKMVRSYDLDTTYIMNYKSSSNVTADYTIHHAVVPDEDKTVTYRTVADNTAKVMNFYKVGVDGKTYLFLKQDDREIVASDLIEVFEADHPKALFGELNCRMESRDWFNLLSTEDGKYQCITDIDQVYNMISQTLYSNCGNNFLTYLQSGGGLENVANTSNSHTTPYLFINSRDKGIFNYNTELYHPKVYITANWANLSKMSLTNGRFDDSYKAFSNSFNEKTTENVVVMLEAAEDAVFEYKVDQQIQGVGELTVSVDDVIIEDGKTAEAGDLLAITVLPGKNQTLNSLTIKGESMEETALALENDFQYMQKNEDGSATYYFTMPYQNCTITASFVKDTIRNAYNITTRISGEGSGRYRVIDENNAAVISNRGSDGNGVAVFGESLCLEMLPDDNCYVESVMLTDTDGNLIMMLSSLEKTYFVMPEQDCILTIRFGTTNNPGTGTADDPYTIATYEELSEYAAYTWSGNNTTGLDAEHYQNAHYKVIESFDAEDSYAGAALAGFKLGPEGEFDGQGHAITHLFTREGLFVYNYGIVKNVVLESGGSNSSNIDKRGGLVYINDGVIDGCEVRNAVYNLSNKDDMEKWLGGLVYQNNGLILNSGVDVNSVLRANRVGGIAYENSETGSIENCYFTGTITLLGTAENEIAAGICVSCLKGQGRIDNCYSAGIVTDSSTYAVIPTDLDYDNVSNCYYEASSTTETDIAGVTAWSNMQSEEFVAQLNEIQNSDYDTWVRTTDGSINGDYPAFDGNQWFYVTENVTGSGAIVTEQESENPVSWGIRAGDKVAISIMKPEGIELESLKICKADDTNTVWEDFGSTTEVAVTFTMPNYDIVIIAQFGNWATEYTIASKITSGIGEIFITDEAGQEITASTVGKTINVEAVPGVGYSLASLEVKDANDTLIKTFTSESGSFTLGSKDCTVYASFAKGEVTYALTASVNGEGTGTVTLKNEDGTDVDGTAKPYTDIQVNLVPEEGAYPSKAQVVDHEGAVLESLIESYNDYVKTKNDDGSYETSFNMPAKDCEVQVTYSLIPDFYNISSEITGSGDVEIEAVSGFLQQGKVTEGTVLRVRGLPTDEEGYVVSAAAYDTEGVKLADLTIDEDYTAKVNETQYKYTVPAQDVVIKVKFYEATTLDDEDGDGIFEISCYDDLVTMSELIQSKPETYASAKYIQICDIDCTNQSWTQYIGDKNAEPFSGTFDGQGYTISGLSIASEDSSEHAGLFGYVQNAVIQNVNLADVKINTGAQNVGAICGELENSTISKCTVTGEITSTSAVEYVGGIAGKLEGSSEINDCANRGSVEASGTTVYGIGGITGYVAENASVKNSYNIGTVAGENAQYAGSIAGNLCGELENCYYLDTTTADSAATAKTIQQFARGEVAFLLNNEVTDGTQNWYQNLDNGQVPNRYPTLTDNGENTVYEIRENEGYSNFQYSGKESVLERSEFRTYQRVRDKEGKFTAESTFAYGYGLIDNENKTITVYASSKAERIGILMHQGTKDTISEDPAGVMKLVGEGSTYEKFDQTSKELLQSGVEEPDIYIDGNGCIFIKIAGKTSEDIPELTLIYEQLPKADYDTTEYRITVKIIDVSQFESVGIVQSGKLDANDPDYDVMLDDSVVVPVELPFVDVAEKNWFYESVKYVYENGLMEGTSKTTFEPITELTREQFALILYRMEGSPAVEYKEVFSDVKEGLWYTDAAIWAEQTGFMIGYGDGTFGINKNITREEMVLVMYRYAETKGYDLSQTADLSEYSDSSAINDWAEEAMQWAVGSKIMIGDDKGLLNPKEDTSRAECAALIMRFVETE